MRRSPDHPPHPPISYADRIVQSRFACLRVISSIDGASVYVAKQERSETVLIAIRRLLGGEQYLSPKTEEKLADI